MAIYPLPVFHFSVIWGGVNGSFTEVSGLTVETQMIEYRGGAQLEFSTVKMPGIQKTSEVSLKRGLFAGDNQLYEWWNTVSMNTIERRDITISLLNENHVPVVVWKIKSAWPTKVEGPSLKGDGNEIAVESITFVHEGITVENNP